MKNFPWLLTGLVVLGVVLVLLFVSRSEYNALQADLEALQQKHESLNANYTESNTNYAQLSANYTRLNTNYAKLNTDYTAVNNELAKIKRLYPPRDFSSVQELKNWLVSNKVSELPPVDFSDAELNYSRALKLQADALKDGYIISVDIDVAPYGLAYIACVAIIDGDFWWWYPDTDEPNLYTGLGKVTRD